MATVASPIEINTGDGVTAAWTYVFEVPGNYSVVTVSTRPVTDENFSQNTLNIEYTHDASTKTITFQTGFIPATGTLIRIERLSNRARPINYVSGSTMEETTLDNDALRLTMVTQEIEAGLLDALRRNDARDAWDGEGLPSENCLDATKADGWVTLQQMEAYVEGGGTTTVGEGVVFVFTGNNFQTLYELDGIEGIHRQLVNVFIENVYQSADGSVYDILRKTSTGYPTGGDDDDYVEFVDPPPAGAKIEIRVLKGTFFTEVPDFSITTGKLADDAVTLSKINVGAGLVDRFLVIDELGDPAARRIGGADMLAAAADENGSLAASFSALIQTLRLDQFVKPNVAIPFNSKKITGLGAGAAGTADACNVSQMETHVSSELLALGGISLKHDYKVFTTAERNNLYSALGATGTPPYLLTVPIAGGFKPDIIFLSFDGILTTPATSVVLIFLPNIPADNGNWRFVTGTGSVGGVAMQVSASNQYLISVASGPSSPLGFGLTNLPVGIGIQRVCHLALKF